MRVARTIETFFPYICGPANQAFQISQGLEMRGVCSPVFTTYCDVDPSLPDRETLGRVTVRRFRTQFRCMRYHISLGMASHLGGFDIIHSHNYRNFQTDCGFFLPG